LTSVDAHTKQVLVLMKDSTILQHVDRLKAYHQLWLLESIAAKCSLKSYIVFAQKKLGGLFPSATKDNDADKNVSFLWLLEAKLPSGKRIACSLALPDTNVGKQGAPQLVLWEGLSS
jgi:hypothetical protein